jgi:ankyrin repeat protein
MKITCHILIVISALCFFGCKMKPATNEVVNKQQETTVDDEVNTEEAGLVSIHEAALSGDLKTVDTYLKSKINPDTLNQDGFTPLMFAAYNGHTSIVKALLDKGADIRIVNQDKLTALHFAASGPYPETVEVLLKHGSDIDAVDGIEHYTPIMYAAAEGNIEVVKILLKYGADITKVDDDGETAEIFARNANHPEVVEILKNYKKPM